MMNGQYQRTTPDKTRILPDDDVLLDSFTSCEEMDRGGSDDSPLISMEEPTTAHTQTALLQSPRPTDSSHRVIVVDYTPPAKVSFSVDQQQDQDQQPPPVSFVGPVILSCIVTWMFCLCYGIVAYSYAVRGQKSLIVGNREKAVSLKEYSYGFSIAGIIFGLFIFGILFAVFGPKASGRFSLI